MIRLEWRQVTVGARGKDTSISVPKGRSERSPVPPLPDTLAGKEMTQSVEGQVWKP